MLIALVGELGVMLIALVSTRRYVNRIGVN